MIDRVIKPGKRSTGTQFIQYYEKYYAPASVFRGNNNQSNQPTAPSPLRVVMTAEEELEFELRRDILLGNHNNAQPANRRTPFTEVSIYFRGECKKLPGLSILDWWRINETKFPTLAQMAKDFLAIPIAGVGVERVFSSARDVCTYHRNRLKGTTISDIMICKEDWREILEDDIDLEKLEEKKQKWAQEAEDREHVRERIALSDEEGDDLDSGLDSNSELDSDDSFSEEEVPRPIGTCKRSRIDTIINTYGQDRTTRQRTR